MRKAFFKSGAVAVSAILAASFALSGVAAAAPTSANVTACVSGNSARFRSRSGSLTAAAFLVVVMWLATAILAWLTKMGCLTE